MPIRVCLSMWRKLGEEAASAPQLGSHLQTQCRRDFNRFGVRLAVNPIRSNELVAPVEIMKSIAGHAEGNAFLNGTTQSAIFLTRCR